MPQRFLRPGITTSQRFNSVDWVAQSFYIRLITLVDDYGRYEADPRLLRSHVFPYGDSRGEDVSMTTIENICKQMLAKKLVFFYSVAGKNYLQLTKWKEHARSASRYPEPNCEQLTTFDIKCSPPSPSPSSSPSPSPLVLPLGIPDAPPPGRSVTDAEWVQSLKSEKAYEGIDVDREYSKMCAWARTNGKKPSRRRFINWLNRAEKPMSGVSGRPQKQIQNI